ncbi:hypothetical protein SMACR_08621 [Sordaria macrospora]|uniref:WGS project CABT00000000 data, contig 2.60 n=2 Tax=Sordaria macrospora TaxID=5147 RepID=F7WAE2_SORMK|nr:uncharacterized protein SMAC_08621 [Sordaria macrospora k-hell]KAA8628215.1 hypothetical protein SMACR_08621 [Sordaria macrospora]KAH7627805.1 hypothetical protein B0T09DRAFT_268634 [Sordaria sp. MPI-SDFR-AT-0083]WPJ65265.1 hypothetical protein SMAC4_08621 [Sordaria macrospora]CCC14177.1 unnamed protein product [Sordaria macrospora k-hell]
MKFTSLFTCALMSLSATGALAQVCEWYLNPDDCICMLSTDGSLLRTQTTSCCKKLGYKTMNSICGVDRKNRQLFKDCCKDLNQESVIGHCR